jgi:hypothetical protein
LTIGPAKAEIAIVPSAFAVAVTATLRYFPRSDALTVYVLELAPGIETSPPPSPSLSRLHWYWYVIGPAGFEWSSQVPSVTLSTRPSSRVPLITGSPVLVGASLTALTVTSTRIVSVALPSETCTTKLSEPL